MLDLRGRASQARALSRAAVHILRGSRIAMLQLQIGALQARLVEQLSPDDIARAEFRVYSQFGEDGIIQFLVQRVPIENEVFVEFGVESYRESNTRFLLEHATWRGLLIDAGEAHKRFLEVSTLAWRTRIQAVSAFIDRDNINRLIAGAGFEGDVGLLSVDLDGNDYWVLEAIDVIAPRIVVVEYNSLFGAERAVTVPYDPGFVRSEKHYTQLYWGASLAALTRLTERKGYALVAGNRAGVNAFFVREDVLGDIPRRTVAECWRPAQFRDARGPRGELTYLDDDRAKLLLLRDMPLVDVSSGRQASVAELYDL
jgi:hypothetical protein